MLSQLPSGNGLLPIVQKNHLVQPSSPLNPFRGVPFPETQGDGSKHEAGLEQPFAQVVDMWPAKGLAIGSYQNGLNFS